MKFPIQQKNPIPALLPGQDIFTIPAVPPCLMLFASTYDMPSHTRFLTEVLLRRPYSHSPQSPLPHNGSGFSLLSKAHSIQQSVLHFHLLQLSVTSFLYVLMLYQRFIKFYAIFVKMSNHLFLFFPQIL